MRPQINDARETDVKPRAELPSAAVQWMQYLLGFGVSVGIGLAPYLGLKQVPFFTPMLSFIPLYIREIAIPLSSAAMGIVAVYIQWYASTQASKGWTKRAFPRVLGATVGLLLLLAVLEMLTVERIFVAASNPPQTASVVVGFGYPNKAPCGGVSRSYCIENRLGVNPASIETYFGAAQVKVAQILLVLSYTLFMSSFGVIVGLLVIARRLDASP